MNISKSAALVIAGLMLLGCSTPPPEPVAVAIPVPEITIDLPPEQSKGNPRSENLIPRVCKLGDSCLALDPRPFEACYVGTKHCSDKREPMQVETLVAPEDAPIKVRAQQETKAKN